MPELSLLSVHPTAAEGGFNALTSSDGSTTLLLLPSCQAVLQDSSGSRMWGPSNLPRDPLLHPLPCTLALLPTGHLSLVDGNGHELWSAGSSGAAPPSGPFLLICSPGKVELVDSSAQVLWRAQGSMLASNTPSPPMMGNWQACAWCWL